MSRKLLSNIIFGLAIAVFVVLAVGSYVIVGHPGQLHPVWLQRVSK